MDWLGAKVVPESGGGAAVVPGSGAWVLGKGLVHTGFSQHESLGSTTITQLGGTLR